ncbi:MAG: hypothetical protein K0U98_25280 [Deltaproteobacteria bacterium]|nr:hypothetical protein [Deltaproteobacteria bacterium]
MTQKSITLFASLLAFLLCVSAFAGGPKPETSKTLLPTPSLSVDITGCEASGTGDFYCSASASGGSGSYNYWWIHNGSGQLYQTNSPNANISGCASGAFSLSVQILDRTTGQTAITPTMNCGCPGD